MEHQEGRLAGAGTTRAAAISGQIISKARRERCDLFLHLTGLVHYFLNMTCFASAVLYFKRFIFSPINIPSLFTVTVLCEVGNKHFTHLQVYKILNNA